MTEHTIRKIEAQLLIVTPRDLLALAKAIEILAHSKEATICLESGEQICLMREDD